MKHYPQEERRILETVAGHEPITEKQLAYIVKLSGRNTEKLRDILESMGIAGLAIETLTKAGGMYIIKCLKGEINAIEDEIEAHENLLYKLRLKLSKLTEQEKEIP